MLLPPVVHGGSIITQHIDWPTFIRPFVCVRLSLHYVLAEPHNLPTHMRRVMHACRLGIRVRCGRVLTSGGYSPTHHTIQCGASCTPHWSVVTVDWWQLCVCVLATPFVTHPCVSSTATAALIPHTCGECWLPVSSIVNRTSAPSLPRRLASVHALSVSAMAVYNRVGRAACAMGQRNVGNFDVPSIAKHPDWCRPLL